MLIGVGDTVVALRSGKRSRVRKGEIYQVIEAGYGGPRPDTLWVSLAGLFAPSGLPWRFYTQHPTHGDAFRKVIHDKPQAAVGNFADWFKTLEEVQ